VRVLVVAVDGVLADTLSARTTALQAAAQSLGLSLNAPRDDTWIAGLSFSEAARVVTAHDSAVDETLLDLLALAADRALQQHAAQSAPVLFPDALARCAEAVEHGWRVMLRTDASRRAVGPLLEHLLTSLNATRAIAADDIRVVDPDQSMVQQQYARLAPSWGDDTHVQAMEASPNAYEAARRAVPALHIGWPTV
jgi:phosphoglycolate phosphatase-like HAD superfamily hydrolase